MFGFGRRDVADGFQQPAMVEPVHPFKGSELHGFKASPRSSSMNDLGFIESVDALSQSVVVGIANTTNRRLDAGFRQPFRVLDRDILAAAIGVMDESCALNGPTLMQGLLQGIEDEPRMFGP